MSILFLDTDNIYLAVRDLLTDAKRALIRRTQSGVFALPLLEEIERRLAVVTRKGKPYAAELAAADQRHDIGGIVLDLVCRVHELLGALPEYAEAAERAAKVRGTLSMERSIVTASYGQEAANALRNRGLLPDIEEVLRAMPVLPGVDGRAVAELFIGGGEDIGRLLSLRADALAEAQAARAEIGGANLLHEARDLLQRTRSMLDNEVSMRPDLPRDLVDRIFSVLDERIAVAVEANTRGRRPAGSPEGAAPPAEGIDGEGRDGTVSPSSDIDGGASEEGPSAAAASDGPRPLRPVSPPE